MKFNTTALEFWHSRQGQNPSLLVFILEDVKIVFQHKYCRSFNIYVAIQDKQTDGNKVQIIPSKVTFSFCITNPKNGFALPTSYDSTGETTGPLGTSQIPPES